MLIGGLPSYAFGEQGWDGVREQWDQPAHHHNELWDETSHQVGSLKGWEASKRVLQRKQIFPQGNIMGINGRVGCWGNLYERVGAEGQELAG